MIYKISDYIDKFPDKLDLLNEIYKNTWNHDNDLMLNNSLWFQKRFIYTNNYTYLILSTWDEKIYFVNSIYTIEEYRKRWYAKNLLLNFPNKNIFLIFDTFSSELKKLMNNIGAKKKNYYKGSWWREQFIYDTSWKYLNTPKKI